MKVQPPHLRVPEVQPDPDQKPRTTFALEVFDQVDQRSIDEDDHTPPYAFFSEIQGRISRAQSGKGPIYDRIFEIVVIATAACESIKRREEEGA